MRRAEIKRKTNETDIALAIDLDGNGQYSIDTGCGFLDHMLELFAAHSSYNLTVKAKGDTRVDYHHTVEDVGIALGAAVYKALGDKRGICRYGSITLPMDEALILVAVDISGRDYLNFDESFPEDYKVGDFDTELVLEFFTAFVREAKITLHIKKLYGTNAHHVIEGTFKGFARALRIATAIDKANASVLPSTKGSL